MLTKTSLVARIILTKSKDNILKLKSMTCKQLGGACDTIFQADTFEEMAELSKKHGMEMLQKQDEAHITAMHQMQELIKQPGAMEKWFESKRKLFELLSGD